jgi:hypothetical protein
MAKGINIDPTISLGAKPPAVMTLPEMLNLARGAEEFRQAQQMNPLLLQQQAEQVRQTQRMNPLLVEQQTAQTGAAKTAEMAASENLSKSRADKVFGIVGGFMNDPRIASGDPQKTVEAILEVRRKAIATGVPEAYVEAILSPISATAAHNPKALPQMISNLIEAQAGSAAQLGLKTPELTTQAGAPALFRRGPGTLAPAPMAGAPMAPAPTAPPPTAPTAPRGAGVTPEMLTAPIGQPAAPVARPQAAPSDPGFPLRYPPRAAGDIRPFAPGEQEAATSGNTYLNNMVVAQGEVPKAIRNVSEVIKGAEELEKTVNFQTGKPADIERAVRTFFGEDQYKQLSKDIANAQISLMRSTGGDLTTDAGKALVARATGDETYPPQVLLSIARRLNGELTKVDMEARGAQRAATLFGNANLPAFQQAWNSNADLRVFEAISIVNNIRDPKKQKSALDKILPTNAEELADFQQKYRNIKKLTETGTLR